MQVKQDKMKAHSKSLKIAEVEENQRLVGQKKMMSNSKQASQKQEKSFVEEEDFLLRLTQRDQEYELNKKLQIQDK